jgi:hypothetical protein
MASTTKKIKVRRRIRIAKLGKRRKAFDRNNGSELPDLPLNKPNANELAQNKAK